MTSIEKPNNELSQVPNQATPELKLFGSDPVIENEETVALEDSVETINNNSVPEVQPKDESTKELVAPIQPSQKVVDPIAKEEAKQKQRESVDNGFERQLLADYALATSGGDMTGDDFIDAAIKQSDKYPKRIVDKVIAKISKGKFADYDDYYRYRTMPEETREEHDKIMDNPVVKEMKSFISKNKQEQEYKLYASVARETNLEIEEIESKYLSDRMFKSVYNSLTNDGVDQETALRKAMLVVNPYVFDKKEPSSLGSVTTTPNKPVDVTKNHTPSETAEKLFTSRYIDPMKDWIK